MNTLAIALVMAAALASAPRDPFGQPRPDARAEPEDPAAVERRFRDHAPGAVPSPVDPFGYTISLRAEEELEYLMPWQAVVVDVRATRTVPANVGSAPVDAGVGGGPSLVDLTARGVGRPPVSAGRERGPVPEKWFRARLEALRLPADRPAYLRLRFRGTDEYFALTYAPGRGLQLVPVATRFGRVRNGAVADYRVLEAAEGTRAYRCDNHEITARDGQKDLWIRRIPLKGAPKVFRVVGDTLFVSSTGGHSLYVRKGDGKIVYYHEGVLAGKDPWDEVLAAAREAYRRAGKDGVPLLFRYIGAAALLGDKRAAPFLIECLDKGHGLTERWWAVAALEHLNGNSGPWKGLGEGQPWDVPRPAGEGINYDRVYRDLAAEVRKWEGVFGKAERLVLTRPEK